jgi:uncharacterized protein YijF (DUF1287 family)
MLTCLILQISSLIITPTQLSSSALSIEDPTIIYNSAFVRVDYPCGDIPSNTGVCTDVIVRAFLKLDVCLQKEIHEYRRSEGLDTERDIDHRRVPEQGQFFASQGWEIDVDSEILPGDIIWWKLNGRVNHIGIVVSDGTVMHNVGYGQVHDVRPHTYMIYRLFRLSG